jgi:hypothetical protein
MEQLLSGLINLGFGGVMAAALIWLLHHLVTKTLPEMMRAFQEELFTERDLRFKEHQALLQAVDKQGERQRKEHEAILEHLVFGSKELLKEITARRTALGNRPEDRPGPPSTRKPRPQ